MDEARLLELGNILVDQIRKNGEDIAAMENEVRQNPTTPLEFVVLLTDKIQQSLGLAGFIDAATGTGMSHLGWSYWRGECRKVIGK